MRVELDINGARVTITGDRLTVSVAEHESRAKASEDNGATGQQCESAELTDSMTGEASRAAAGRSAAATSETMDATAGETAQDFTEQRANVLSQHEVRPGSTSLGTEQECDTLGVTAGETASIPAKIKIAPVAVLRAHCLNPAMCAGSGRNHCHRCTKENANLSPASSQDATDTPGAGTPPPAPGFVGGLPT